MCAETRQHVYGIWFLRLKILLYLRWPWDKIRGWAHSLAREAPSGVSSPSCPQSHTPVWKAQWAATTGSCPSPAHSAARLPFFSGVCNGTLPVIIPPNNNKKETVVLPGIVICSNQDWCLAAKSHSSHRFWSSTCSLPHCPSTSKAEVRDGLQCMDMLERREVVSEQLAEGDDLTAC